MSFSHLSFQGACFKARLEDYLKENNSKQNGTVCLDLVENLEHVWQKIPSIDLENDLQETAQKA